MSWWGLDGQGPSNLWLRPIMSLMKVSAPTKSHVMMLAQPEPGPGRCFLTHALRDRWLGNMTSSRDPDEYSTFSMRLMPATNRPPGREEWCHARVYITAGETDRMASLEKPTTLSHMTSVPNHSQTDR